MLEKDKTYFTRVRLNGSNGSASNWSEPKEFIAKAIRTPWFIHTTNIKSSYEHTEVEVSPFTSRLTFLKIETQTSLVSDFSEILFTEEYNDNQSFFPFKISLVNNKVHYIRFRYYATNGSVSDWSNTKTLTYVSGVNLVNDISLSLINYQYALNGSGSFLVNSSVTVDFVPVYAKITFDSEVTTGIFSTVVNGTTSLPGLHTLTTSNSGTASLEVKVRLKRVGTTEILTFILNTTAVFPPYNVIAPSVTAVKTSDPGQGVSTYPNGLPVYNPGQGVASYPNGLPEYRTTTVYLNSGSVLCRYNELWGGGLNESTIESREHELATFNISYVRTGTNDYVISHNLQTTVDNNHRVEVSSFNITSKTSIRLSVFIRFKVISNNSVSSGTVTFDTTTTQVLQGSAFYPNGLPSYIAPVGNASYPNGLPSYIAPKLYYTLTASGFDANWSQSHQSTEWQISTVNNFSTLFQQTLISTGNLLRINTNTLTVNKTYYARCRLVSNQGVQSTWSTVINLVT